MGQPSTLAPKPLNDKDRLKLHLEAFFEGYIWEESDPAIIQLKSDGVTAGWQPDAYTAKYLLNKFIDRAIDSLVGNEWVLRHPVFYLNIDKSHIKVISQVNTKDEGHPLEGSWNDSTKILFIETHTRPTKIMREISVLVHEYAHSKKLGFEDSRWTLYNHDEWFGPTMKNKDGSSNWDKIMDSISTYALTKELLDLPDLPYLSNKLEQLETNPLWKKKVRNSATGKYVDMPQSVKDGYVARTICEEILARVMNDIAIGNSLHDDLDYLFQPGWVDIIFAPQFKEKLRLMAWPRLPENKPDLLHLFKGGSLW